MHDSDVQTVKPRARNYDYIGASIAKLNWFVYCPLASAWGSTLDDALREWRQQRLLAQTKRSTQ